MYDYHGHSGFLNDISVTLIDKTDPKDPTKKENYWIHTLKPKAQLECYVKDGINQNFLYFASDSIWTMIFRHDF